MNFDLSEEQVMLQDAVKQYLQNECPLDRLREIFDARLDAPLVRTFSAVVHDLQRFGEGVLSNELEQVADTTVQSEQPRADAQVHHCEMVLGHLASRFEVENVVIGACKPAS